MSEKHRGRRSYVIGYVLSLILALMGFQLLPRHTALWIAVAAALIKIAVHLRFFLYIRLRARRARICILSFLPR
ncbi:hypothetical protein [Falsirhodobacter deserti]|uniref:hypothetical protein n=1 Tax=Falsirhodobacter deserti TaxID=1365611 RepID=UPI001F4ED77E|nr:hypothetical protein [Falsirhodobacter deserti]